MKTYLLLLLLLTGFFKIQAQETNSVVTLEQVIAQAQKNSLTFRQAETSRETSYWQWRTYLADYKPTLSLAGTLPDFSRSINPVTQPDGTTDFKQVSINNALLDLGISQSIGLTGGQVFVNSQLQRFDDFNASATRYNSNPALIGFSQPLFRFNKLTWARKIEPLRYAESQKRFVEDREVIAQDITRLYFDLLLQQVNQSIATKNRTNTEDIIRIAEEKFKLGKISKNDVLQLRLSLLNSQIAQAEADLAVKNATLALNNYLGETAAKPLQLAVPGNLPILQVTEDEALAQARQNRKESIAFKRTLLQAERDLAEARQSNGFNATMFATFGLTNQATNLVDSYGNPENQQRVRIGFELPIMDGGKQKSLRKTAQANLKLAQYAVEQDQLEFEQNIRTQVNQFQMLKTRVAITAEADQIAQSRYDIAKATYVIGRISITDLNIALGEKDQAKRAYISSLRDFWTAFYNLRTLTLYDFENNIPITIEP
jgi:outer membrane protein TolC